MASLTLSSHHRLRPCPACSAYSSSRPKLLTHIIYTYTMQALQDSLTSLLASLPPRPINKVALDALVAQTLEESRSKTSPDTWKAKWEYVLRKEVYELAVSIHGHLSALQAHPHAGH